MHVTNLARAAFVFGMVSCGLLHASGRLEISRGWIRAAPPGATMLAGYAVLSNRGDRPVIVIGAHSDAFASVSLHESVEMDGVERMRPLERIEIAPGASVALAPGGKHLMLMHPSRPLAVGASAAIHLETADGGGASASLLVRESAPDTE